MTTELKRYPNSDLDIPLRFQGQTGSFWSRDFKEKAQLAAITQARLRAFDQTQDLAIEVENLISRFTAPVTHRERWIPMYFRRRNGRIYVSAPLTYGPDKALYGEAADNPPFDRVFKYGEGLLDRPVRALPLPDGIVNIRILSNRVTNPSLNMVEGVNFHILLDDNLITTDVNVFDDSRISSLKYPSQDDISNATDEEIRLWAYGVEFDKEYMWKHFGYVVGLHAPSSAGYKNLVNAIWDLHTAASNKAAIYKLLGAVMDVPYALEDGEVVEHILTKPRTQIITDKRVYDVSSESNIIVSVGDVMTQYQGFTDTVEVQDLKFLDDGLRLYSKYIPNDPDYTGGLGYNTSGVIPFTASGNVYVKDYYTLLEDGGYTGYMRDPANPNSWIRDPDNGLTAVELADADVQAYNFNYSIEGSQLVVKRPYSYPSQFTKLVPVGGRNETFDLDPINWLGEHTHIRIKFRVLVTGNWKGNASPSTFSVIVDGETVKTTTFSNAEGTPQAYPGNIGASNPAFTGAERYANNSDADQFHVWISEKYPNSAIYDIDFVIPHTAPSANISLSASGLEDADRWTVIIPAPAVGLFVDIYSRPDNPDYHFSVVDGRTFKILQAELTAAEFEARYGFDPATDVQWDIPAGFKLQYMWYPTTMWRIFNYRVTPLIRDASDRVKLPPANPAQTDNPDIPGITLTESFLSGNYLAGLFFANKEVDLEYVGADEFGNVEVRFELSGYPGDIEEFWEQTQRRGVAQGFTLANYLDLRPNPVGQPKPHHLPATINPMLFVLKHIMGYNLFIIKLKVGLGGKHALDPGYLTILRKVLPPHTAFIIFTEINVDVQEFDEPHYETIAAGSGPLLTEVGGLTVDLRPPAVTGVELYI